jgi:argininosuccinate lyase
MESLKITHESLSIMALLFDHMEVNADKIEQDMSEELFATEQVYELVKQGVPFRDAYLQISKKYK